MSQLNEIFGDPLSLCGWSVGNREVRIQTREARFRVPICNLNRDQAPNLRPRLVGVGQTSYLRTCQLPLEPKTARAFVLRQLGRAEAHRSADAKPALNTTCQPLRPSEESISDASHLRGSESR